MPESQGLRWWQEESTQPTYPRIAAEEPKQLADGVAIEAANSQDSEFRDIGEELEAEARARAEAEAIAARETVSLCADSTQLRRMTRREMVWLGALWGFVLLISLVRWWIDLVRGQVSQSDVLEILAPLSCFFCLYLDFSTRQWIKRHGAPGVLLKPQGLEIRVPFKAIRLIPWSDVQEVRVRRVLGVRRLLVKGRGLGAIRIAECYLPLKADAMVARIAAYKAARNG